MKVLVIVCFFKSIVRRVERASANCNCIEITHTHPTPHSHLTPQTHTTEAGGFFFSSSPFGECSPRTATRRKRHTHSTHKAHTRSTKLTRKAYTQKPTHKAHNKMESRHTQQCTRTVHTKQKAKTRELAHPWLSWNVYNARTLRCVKFFAASVL